jgi:glycosyltransferase involved in cell wall biosynthesis
MRKVIHLNDNIRLLGGVEVYLEQLHRLLPQRGWQSDWLGVERTGRRVKLLRYGSPGWSWAGTVEEFRAFLATELSAGKGGLLHVHSISDPCLIRACLEVAPVVRTMHEPRIFCPGHGKFWSRSETPCTKPFGVHCLWHAYAEKCCNRHPKRLLKSMRNTHFEIHEASSRYAAIIANSNYIQRAAIEAGIPEAKIQVLSYFAEDIEPVSLDLPTGSPRIFFAGRLSKTKGVDYLLRALALVLKQMPTVKLDIAGGGMDEKHFMHLAQVLGIADAVAFHGWCARGRVAELIAVSSIVAFPSIYPEAFGIVGIEAMMHERPVVAFDVGGVRDWMDDEVTGILVPPKNIDAFAHAVVRLLKSRFELLKMGCAARRQALDRFSVQAHFQGLLAVYERAAKQAAACQA